MKKHLPNILTAANAFCGLLAMLFVFQDNLGGVAGTLGAALLLDFFDGLLARILKVHSALGQQLDSLADAISFGVVPGLIMARLIVEAGGGSFLPTDWWAEGFPWFLAGLLIPVLSVVRLARFNLDTRQGDVFYGLPTPANTLLVFSYWLIFALRPDFFLTTWLNTVPVLVGLSLLSAWLLVADVRLLALKFKGFAWSPNRYRYLLVGGTVLLLGSLQVVALPFVILYYLLLSVVVNVVEGRSKEVRE